MKISNKTYNSLKFVALVLLPAIATLYYALSTVWGWGYGAEVVASMTALDTFFGILLNKMSRDYQNDIDGTLQVKSIDENGMPELRLEIHKTPDAMLEKGNINVRVDPPGIPAE